MTACRHPETDPMPRRPRFAQVAPPTSGRAEVQRASRVGGPQRPVRGEAARDPVRHGPGQQAHR